MDALSTPTMAALPPQPLEIMMSKEILSNILNEWNPPKGKVTFLEIEDVEVDGIEGCRFELIVDNKMRIASVVQKDALDPKFLEVNKKWIHAGLTNSFIEHYGHNC